MVWQDTALGMAGVMGAGVAVFHGVLVQRWIVKPLQSVASADRRFSAPIRRLIAPLLHFSTLCWLAGGLALIAAAFWSGRETRLVIGLIVGVTYLLGAIFNFWATRGRHPGWMLMGAALLLMLLGTLPRGD